MDDNRWFTDRELEQFLEVDKAWRKTIESGLNDGKCIKVPVSSVYGTLLGGHQHLPSLQIKKVIFNSPATIIMWNDGSKTVVKCQTGDEYDPEKGFVMAYLKKLLGNDNTFNKEINKWVWEER